MSSLPGESLPSSIVGRSESTEQRRALDHTFSLIYEELRRVAAGVRRGNLRDTMNPTALVNEAWLKLKDTPELAETSVPHFKGIAGKAMRQVLVDQARSRGARKRGGSGEAQFVSLDVGEAGASLASCDEELLDLDTALHALASSSPRRAQIVEYRFFGGLNVAETAELLGVSESVVEREWRAAKAWLALKIRPQKD